MDDYSGSDPDRTAGALLAILKDEVVNYSGTAEPVLPVSKASAVCGVLSRLPGHRAETRVLPC